MFGIFKKYRIFAVFISDFDAIHSLQKTKAHFSPFLFPVVGIRMNNGMGAPTLFL
jgi:hypothetical protein